MTNEKIYRSDEIMVEYDPENHIFQMIPTNVPSIFGEHEMVKVVMAISEKLYDLIPLSVGDHVKVLGNAPETAWETGCIEHIDGCMAYIVYGVKTLTEFGGIRGMGMPVPLSQLRRVKE
jgi:hypothetical protein